MKKKRPSLLWVYGDSLSAALDRATWLETSTELCNLGWQVTLAASDFPPDGIDTRIEELRLAKPRMFIIGYLVLHFSLLIQIFLEYRDVDIILFHQYSAPLFLTLALFRKLFRRCRPKFMMDSRSAQMNPDSSLRAKLWTLYFAVTNAFANRLADAQTTITMRLAKDQGIPERQLAGTWPSGVNLKRFEPSLLMRCWPGINEPLCLVYIGSLRPERNLLALCQAVQIVRAEALVVSLVLVGEGIQRGELEKYARENGEGVIKVHQAVPASEVPRILSASHVGVLPFPDLPIFRVSSPIKLFEYMAAGMPILATRVVCHTDVLGDSDFVFWAEDGSPTALAAAIRATCIRKAELSNMGQKAALAAQDWTWENSAKRLAEALETNLNDATR